MSTTHEQIQFTKMTGAGNDFVLVDNRDTRYRTRWEHFARASCDRRYGIGADGLLLLESSSMADFRMLYFNADGSSGGMCGNGGRCAAAFVMRGRRSDQVKFEAIGYVYSASRSGASVKLKMKNPTAITLDGNLMIADSMVPYHFVDTGAPHVVFYFEELPAEIQSVFLSEGIDGLGRIVRYHPNFSPAGTNVNVVSKGLNGAIEMRTFERGVETETLACGTGAVACSVISALRWDSKPPINVKTRSGEVLQVNFQTKGDTIFDIELDGPVRFVFTGEINIDLDQGHE